MNPTVGSNLLQLVHRNSKRMCIPASVTILFIGYNLATNTDGRWWLYWMILSILIYVFRVAVMRFLSSTKSLSIRAKIVSTCAYSAINGITLGLCILFFPQLGLPERLVISLVLAGFGAGSSAANIGYSPFFLSFILPLLAPLGVLWFMNPDGYLGDTVAASLGVLIVMIIVLLTVLGRDTFNTFSAYIEMSEKQSSMSAELADALERARIEQKRAEVSSESKTRFLAAASHDLRQPVHVVSLYGAALKTVAKDARVIEVVDDMNQAIGSLSSQLDTLLDISKLDVGGVQPELRIIEFCDLVNEVKTELEANAASKGLALVCTFDEPVYVLSDRGMLLQILRNVVGNAIKYTEQGSVEINCELASDYVTLVCKDTGIGMSPDEQLHVFEEFYQISNPQRDSSKGLGLGLSIVDRLVKGLSHELTIESKLDIGTSVRLRLKRTSDEIAVDITKPSRIISTDPETSLDLHIHLVDDEKLVRESMTLLLNAFGCRVTSTSATLEAIESVKRDRPDIVFADLRLQLEDSGIKTLNAISEIDAAIECVLITGETFFRLQDVGLKEKVQILHKPVSRDRLLELLRDFKSRQSSI